MSPDVAAFVAVLLKVVLYNLCFAGVVFATCIVGRTPGLVAPLQPESACGQSTSLWGWLRSIWAIDLEAVRAVGGLDAELYARRLRMRVAVMEIFLVVGVPLAVIYGATPGGAYATGFDRVGVANVWRDGGDRNFLWATVIAMWLMHLLAMRIGSCHQSSTILLDI